MPLAPFGEMHLNKVLRSWENFHTFSYIATRGCGSSADKKISTPSEQNNLRFSLMHIIIVFRKTVLTEFDYMKTLKQLGMDSSLS